MKCVELKAEKGKPSGTQLEFLSDWHRAGGVGATSFSLDEAIMVFYNDPLTLYAHVEALSGAEMYLGGNYAYFAAATLAE